MRKWMIALTSFLVVSCAAFWRAPDGGLNVDFVRLADEINLVQQDISDLMVVADQDMYTDWLALTVEIDRVEASLRLAGSGGPVESITQAALAALGIADAMAASADPQSDLRFYIGVARITLRHLAAAEFAQAGESLDNKQPTNQ